MYVDARLNVERFGDLLVGQKFFFFNPAATRTKIAMKISVLAMRGELPNYVFLESGQACQAADFAEVVRVE